VVKLLRSPVVEPSPKFHGDPDILDHPTIWDMFFYKGYVLTADLRGGFYSLQFDARR
jgi:hypothetical protein